MTENTVLSVENLKNYFYTRAGVVKAVDGVSFYLNSGETLGLAGESGCGKSITCLSILRLVPQPPGRTVAGKILFEGEDLLTKKESEMNDWVAIMYGGRIVESGTVNRVYEKPDHPYTQALMKAIPRLENRTKKMFQIEGEPPNPADLPSGCTFHPRCPNIMDICRAEYPPITTMSDRDYAACWLLKNGKA